jgi:hypothetical protein
LVDGGFVAREGFGLPFLCFNSVLHLLLPFAFVVSDRNTIFWRQEGYWIIHLIENLMGL